MIQINGKIRDSIEMEVQKADNQTQVEQMAKESAKTQKWLQGRKIKKTVFVPGKLISFVV